MISGCMFKLAYLGIDFTELIMFLDLPIQHDSR